MIHVRVMLWGLAGAILGFIVLAVIGVLFSSSGGSADATAGRTMVAVFVIAPFGGLIGLILATRYALHRRDEPSWPLALGYSAVTLMTATSIAGAFTYFLIATDPVSRPGDARLALEFEIRLPQGAATSDALKAAKIELRSSVNRMPGVLIADIPRDDGKYIVIGGRVPIVDRTPTAILALMISNQPERSYPIKRPAKPSPPDTWSRWEEAYSPNARAGIRGDSEVRYRAIDADANRAP